MTEHCNCKLRLKVSYRYIQRFSKNMSFREIRHRDNRVQSRRILPLSFEGSVVLKAACSSTQVAMKILVNTVVQMQVFQINATFIQIFRFSTIIRSQFLQTNNEWRTLQLMQTIFPSVILKIIQYKNNYLLLQIFCKCEEGKQQEEL